MDAYWDSHVDSKAMIYNPGRDGIPEPIYGALAMCGEAGELAGKIKKLYRDDKGALSPDRRAAILDELGDILFYLTYTAHAFHFTLNDVAKRNVEKLADRAKRGVQLGDGDHR